jgi:hypothetical protein
MQIEEVRNPDSNIHSRPGLTRQFGGSGGRPRDPEASLAMGLFQETVSMFLSMLGAR